MRYDPLTRHGRQRSGERLGLSASAARKQATRAWVDGIQAHETRGCLAAWLEEKATNSGAPRTLRIYGEHVYVFSPDGKLVTVLHLPHEHRHQVAKIKHRRTQA